MSTVMLFIERDELTTVLQKAFEQLDTDSEYLMEGAENMCVPEQAYREDLAAHNEAVRILDKIAKQIGADLDCSKIRL